MDELRRISRRVLGLAAKLLLVFVLLVGPYAHAGSASGGAPHHAAMSLGIDNYQALAHEHADEIDGGSSAFGQAGPDPVNIAEKCCDLFCVSVAFIVPSDDLASREPVTVAHVLADADVAPGEWVVPHRPPNT
jgi:hypothetical protein